MTLDELRQLPSRDRDALVAERVMGWTVYRQNLTAPGTTIDGPDGPIQPPDFAHDVWVPKLMERMRAMRFRYYDDSTVAQDFAVAIRLRNQWECGWQLPDTLDEWAKVQRQNHWISLRVHAPTAGEAVVLAAIVSPRPKPSPGGSWPRGNGRKCTGGCMRSTTVFSPRPRTKARSMPHGR